MKCCKLLLLVLVITMAGNIDATTKAVKPGDNLYSILRKSAAKDTILLQSGQYKIDKTITLANNLVIIGDSESKPVITWGTITVDSSTKDIVLENLKIILDRKYFIQITGNKDIDLDNIIFRNCIIDLNTVGATLLMNNATGSKNRLANYTIENSMVHNVMVPSHGLLNFTTDNHPRVDHISLINSTFSNFSRGLMFCKQLVSQSSVNVSNCTFYNINTSNNNSGIFRCSVGQVDINVEKSIFHFSGDKTKFIVLGEEGKAKVIDSYRTSELTTIVSSRGLRITQSTANDLFESPNDTPCVQSCSFFIKDKSLSDLHIGDPRWFKKQTLK